MLDLAVKDPWIRDYQDAPSPPPTAPATGVVVGSVPSQPTPTQSSVPPGRSRLPPPDFSLSASTLPLADFDLSLTLTDRNAVDESEVHYSINYGDWILYDGSPLSIPPGAVVKSQTIPIDSDSFYVSSSDFSSAKTWLS